MRNLHVYMEKPFDLNFIKVIRVFGGILTNLSSRNHHEKVGVIKIAKKINIDINRIRKIIILKVDTV